MDINTIVNITENLGVVVIGRNEGERLRRCLLALQKVVTKIVYVDSGSSDDSVTFAQQIGVETLALDLAIPFTAARARNSGFQHLLDLHPDIQYVQFVDGDCEIMTDWLPIAVSFLNQHPDCAVVCGRLRERYPDKSVYNQLCDWEWDGPVGEIKASGGNALMRVKAFVAVAGFREDVIAAEDDEVCLRMRLQGWKVWRIQAEMALHDANMMHFKQWWKRATRAGYAYALGAYLHGMSPERHFVRETLRVWFWGLITPVSILLLSLIISPWALVLALVYPLRLVRLAKSNSVGSWQLATLLILCHFPELLGQLKFIETTWSGKKATVIEHRNAS